jgi:CDP-diacylglycerol--glycerol-3-phosphate 3-phosphatidyltransferase
LLSLALLGASAYALARLWPVTWALQWLGVTAGVTGYLLWVSWNHLPNNRPDGQQEFLYPDLGLPNLLTYWRGVLIAATAGFLLLPRPEGILLWAPGILFSLGVLPDYFDGYLARLSGRVTRLGEELDVAVDGVAVLTAVLLGVSWGQVPRWYLLVGLARYAFLFGIWLRRRMGKPVYPLPPNLGRRALAGAMMGFNMVMLWPLFGPPSTLYVAYLFGVPFLINFGRDWMSVSGISVPRFNFPRWLIQTGKTWLPLGLRLIVLLGMGYAIWLWLPRLENLIAQFADLGVVYPALLVGLLLALEGVVLVCVALGIMGRTMGILGMCLLGLHLRFQNTLALELLLPAIAAGLIFFFGSGGWSMWAPEEELLQRRAGEGHSA